MDLLQTAILVVAFLLDAIREVTLPKVTLHSIAELSDFSRCGTLPGRHQRALPDMRTAVIVQQRAGRIGKVINNAYLVRGSAQRWTDTRGTAWERRC